VNRHDFEVLRDLPGKRIDVPIRLAQKQATQPIWSADRIPIVNDADVLILMNINFNPETGAKGINVTLVGEGPICRLDVDGARHGDAGRSHKHAVQDEQSIRQRLCDGVLARAELSGRTLSEVLATFCDEARIALTGPVELPEGS